MRCRVLAVVGALWGCQVVEGSSEEACDAAARAFAGATIGEGIAGVVASRSDVVSNGVAECSWARAQLDVWRTEALVTDPVTAGQVLAGGPPVLSLEVDRRYEQALAVGNYLVCALPGACAAVEVRPGQVTSVNVEKRYGPTGLVVFTPDARERRLDRVMMISRNAPMVHVLVEGLGYLSSGERLRMDVLEPGVVPAANLSIAFRALGHGRALQFDLQQEETWPPREQFELAAPAPGQRVRAVVSEYPVSANGQWEPGSPSVNARSGAVRLRFLGAGRFEGEFDLVLAADAGAPGERRKGTIAGFWMFSCASLPEGDRGGSVRRVDTSFADPFCADQARRAGIRP